MTVLDGEVWFVDTVFSFVADYPVHADGGKGTLMCYDGKNLTEKK